MANNKLRVGLVGLGFGAEFIPIYQAHPNAEVVALCQRNEQSLNELADKFGVEGGRYTSYEDMLADPNVDAIHINTPIGDHAKHSIMALEAGKHVACTVPMATSVEDCERIVKATKASGKKYMMMETVVYSREYLFVKEMYDRGDLGRIQFLQASHQQDMDGWPSYWEGMPPMHYATHCVGPVLGLQRKLANQVQCIGSGKIRDEFAGIYGSPFAIESCHIQMQDSDVGARIYRSLYDTARQYRESFDVYGSEKSYEWPLVEGENPVMHTRGKPEPEVPEQVTVPDYAHLLPEEIRSFTGHGVYDEANEHLSFTQGGGHGGSHPHLVHNFIRCVLEDYNAYPNVVESANITCVGILAHESALAGGEVKKMPAFTLE
ncbi:Gfo/Idh/MocA family protein [Gilvimarinus xylanilyticus]|uniref:Gfo/Idh/MocA family oxidoreductase n=1 Tax=Gilvimarinus xylanilyticus TaxID=2944139 RepID=A0A9X2I1Q9_9GAMM|nr:Gfo/Idh/MocA family oxidoreductase [Gilvimarinus xylanilyticus]MCP8899093.1 Gfo/Idh/MocA family oxidoreductase [Gilvimarinus xylanilyticus]